MGMIAGRVAVQGDGGYGPLGFARVAVDSSHSRRGARATRERRRHLGRHTSAGREASAVFASLVPGSDVTPQMADINVYGRMVAYVLVDGGNVNAEMVCRGSSLGASTLRSCARAGR